MDKVLFNNYTKNRKDEKIKIESAGTRRYGIAYKSTVEKCVRG
jgi:hypothetical protein